MAFFVHYGGNNGAMNHSNLLLVLIFSLGLFANAQSLQDYQWKNRILLAIDTTKESRALLSQLSKFKDQRGPLDERDLLVFAVTDKVLPFGHGTTDTLAVSEIRTALGISKKFKGIILIGKDGGIKYKGNLETDPQLIFDKIDAMPMRRAEMRKD